MATQKNRRGPRRQARELALQTLYEIDVTTHPPGIVLSNHLDGTLDQHGEDFVRHLVQHVLQHQAELDEYLQKLATEGPLANMPPVHRAILRMALYELLYQHDTDIGVIINEAVELAQRFGGETSPGFVHGVLGTFTREYLQRGEQDSGE